MSGRMLKPLGERKKKGNGNGKKNCLEKHVFPGQPKCRSYIGAGAVLYFKEMTGQAITAEDFCDVPIDY